VSHDDHRGCVARYVLEQGDGIGGTSELRDLRDRPASFLDEPVDVNARFPYEERPPSGEPRRNFEWHLAEKRRNTDGPSRREPVGRRSRAREVARHETFGPPRDGHEVGWRDAVVEDSRGVVRVSPPKDARGVDPAGARRVRRVAVTNEDDAARQIL